MAFGFVEPTFSKPKHYQASICILLVINVASLLASAKLLLVLNPEDRISSSRGASLTALGFVYFMSLFEMMNVALLHTPAGARFRHRYSLTSGDVLDINNKLVSAVQALFCVGTGAAVCAWSCRRDFLRTSHYISEAYAWFGAAYFFYDIWSMYMVHVIMTSGRDARKPRTNGAAPLSPDSPSSRDSPASLDPPPSPRPPGFLAYCTHEPVILMHHLFIGGFGFLVIVWLRGSLGDCTFGFVYLMEVSTPFVSLRGVLSRLRLKASSLYLANGVAMLASFFVCRVASLPYVCLMYSRVVQKPYFEAINSLPRGCKISILILLLPQLYWFYLMSAGALKMFLKSDKKDKSDKIETSDDKLLSEDCDKLSSGDAARRRR